MPLASGIGPLPPRDAAQLSATPLTGAKGCVLLSTFESVTLKSPAACGRFIGTTVGCPVQQRCREYVTVFVVTADLRVGSQINGFSVLP
jgi:hypothetical protein